MAKKADNFDYTAKAAELEQILAQLQDSDIALDVATKLHAQGLKLVEEIETYLNQAENQIRLTSAGQ